MIVFKDAHESWVPLLHSLAYKEPLVNLLSNLREISHQPPFEEIFKVFEMPVKDIKVVILGKEPNPIPGTATGYAYAVQENSKETKKLEEIRKEVVDDSVTRRSLGINPSMLASLKPWQKHLQTILIEWKTLEHWTQQGVFLLNTALTVETVNPGSHLRIWEDFTKEVITFISKENPCVWMLWGDTALDYGRRINNPFMIGGYDEETIKEIPNDPEWNYIIPGKFPLAGEGFSNKGFSFTNTILKNKCKTQIIW